MNKKNIAVVYGGFSSEFEISVLSGKYVSSIIDKKLFNVFNVKISKNEWIEENTNLKINKSDFSITKNSQKIQFDLIVNVIHGSPGENGQLQAYWNLLGIPFVGSNSFVSALTFNKYYCNIFLKNFDINISNSILVRKNENFETKLDKFITKAGLPVFVKPSNGGSSFGTFKVNQKEDLKKAISKAFNQDEEVMLEQFISGREFTCAVIKNKNKIQALTPIEIISKNDFFDYESKYNSNLNEEIIPAPIDQKTTTLIKTTSEKIFKLLNCDGISRIDYILNGDKLFFLEINTIPGMTSESLVPKVLKYENIDITNLYTDLINAKIK